MPLESFSNRSFKTGGTHLLLSEVRCQLLCSSLQGKVCVVVQNVIRLCGQVCSGVWAFRRRAAISGEMPSRATMRATLVSKGAVTTHRRSHSACAAVPTMTAPSSTKRDAPAACAACFAAPDAAHDLRVGQTVQRGLAFRRGKSAVCQQAAIQCAVCF